MGRYCAGAAHRGRSGRLGAQFVLNVFFFSNNPALACIEGPLVGPLVSAVGYAVEGLFQALGIIPQNRNVVAITEGVQCNYTSILNILLLAAILVMRFLRTSGVPTRRDRLPEEVMLVWAVLA